MATFFSLGRAQASGESKIEWLHDDREAFRIARDEQKPVLLYLEAVWCHWCHVIDRETYGNDEVAELINQHFVPLRIDQDNRPDLANRYRNYGWPATIFFTPEGVDMVKRQGFIAPQPMANLLRAILADPSPEAAAALTGPTEFATSSSLDETLLDELMGRHVSNHDAEMGGLASNQKFLDRDTVELDLVLAGDSDAAAEERARRTLDAALALIDPVWGGVYQYSTYRDWVHPHFEKLGTAQGEYLRIYALAGARLDEDRYLDAARAIQRYLVAFLTSPEGAFYASQDADLIQGQKAVDYFALDDAQRRALGIPRVDQKIYARENGAMIEGLATLYEFTRDESALDAAIRSADWIVQQRMIEGGGYRHDQTDPAGPYLGDSLAMGRAFLALYKATAERRWIEHASQAAAFIDQHFQAGQAGYTTAVSAGAVIQPLPTIDENIALVRFTNLMHQITGTDLFRAMADRAMRYLATPEVALRQVTEAGIVLSDREFNRDPLHFTVLGSKSDSEARRLYQATLDQPGWYKRAEWWDVAEGPLPNPDVTYPQLKRAAAFVCTDNRCSLPIYQPEGLAEFLALAPGG